MDRRLLWVVAVFLLAATGALIDAWADVADDAATPAAVEACEGQDFEESDACEVQIGGASVRGACAPLRDGRWYCRTPSAPLAARPP